MDLFNAAKAGRRQCLLISGGPGTGKTALTETFARTLATTADSPLPLVVHGHCFEQFGTSEPYMPVWEAIGRAAQQCTFPKISALLEMRNAAQTSTATHASPTAPDAPSTPIGPRADRMLREMSEAIESMAAQVPVLLAFEDIQWADHSTIDLISALAGRSVPANLMVIATYRPAEIAIRENPIRQAVERMHTAGRCRELSLGCLNEDDVNRFLTLRFPGCKYPNEFARRLHQRTEGCPLFLVHVADDLVDHGVFMKQDSDWQLAGCEDPAATQAEIPAWLAVLDTQIPRTLRAMIESHVECLEPDARNVIEAAAVAGVEFSAAAVAAAIGADVVDAERVCEALARQHRFLEHRGVEEWPDGVISTHYRFVHELYHNVVYEQVPIARRVQLHETVGLRIEAAWGSRAPEEAANLAMHFETARNWLRAVQYLRNAAHAAGRQYAHREAVHYLRRALAATSRLETSDRQRYELEVLNALGVNLQVTRGFASPEVEEIQSRAHALCVARFQKSGGDTATSFPVLWGIWLFHKVRSNLETAGEMAGHLLTMAQDNPAYLLQAHQAMCVTHLCKGDPLTTCHHMEKAAALYDPLRHAGNGQMFGQDPGVSTLAFGSIALWILGRPQDALQASERSIALARRLRQPSSMALAMHFSAMLHQLRGDAEQTARWAQDTITLSEQEGFSFWRAGALILRGWSGAARGYATESAEAGIGDICRGIDAWLATGSRTYHTYYLGLLADALQRTGRAAEAQQTLEEALLGVRNLGEALYEAELHRLKGRGILLLSPQDPCPSTAQACFVKAITTARLQTARLFEERAASDLARLLGRNAPRNLRQPPAPEAARDRSAIAGALA
jgi:adenylate cyclase